MTENDWYFSKRVELDRSRLHLCSAGLCTDRLHTFVKHFWKHWKKWSNSVRVKVPAIASLTNLHDLPSALEYAQLREIGVLLPWCFLCDEGRGGVNEKSSEVSVWMNYLNMMPSLHTEIMWLISSKGRRQTNQAHWKQIPESQLSNLDSQPDLP